jgi:hypothetical protein
MEQRNSANYDRHPAMHVTRYPEIKAIEDIYRCYLICSFLGISHIWIDSLCIIQRSQTD